MQPYGATPVKPGMSGGQKAVIGCVIGCGAVIVLAVLAGGIGAWWMMRPGEQHETTAVVSDQAHGSFRVGDLGADAGVTALLDRFVLETQRQQHAGMPPWVRQLQQMGQAGGSPSSSFRMMLPKQATISLEPSSAGDGTAVVAAINPRGMTGFFKLLLSRADNEAGSHRGHDVMRLGKGAWVSLVGGTWLFASEEEALRHGIDRFLDGGAAGAPVATDLGAPSRPWDVTGTVDQSDDELAQAIWGETLAPQGVRRALIGIDVATSDTTQGRVVVDCDSAESAAAAAVALDQRASERARELAEKGLALRAATRVDGSRAVIDWDLTGVDAAIAVWVAQSQQGRSPTVYESDDDAAEPEVEEAPTPTPAAVG
jgi:hypothetical protein